MRKLIVIGAVVVALSAGATLLAYAQTGLPVTELPVRFNARAQNHGNYGSNATARVELNITSWSTAEQRQQLLTALNEGDQAALKAALVALPQAGYVRVNGRASYPVQFAMEATTTDGKRLIRMATDRNISDFEAIHNSRVTDDYAFTLVQMILEEDYKGEGTAVLAAQFEPDPEHDSFKVKSYDSGAIKLASVHKVNIR